MSVWAWQPVTPAAQLLSGGASNVSKSASDSFTFTEITTGDDWTTSITRLNPNSWWKFNETSGTVFTDSISGFNGTATGVVTAGSPSLGYFPEAGGKSVHLGGGKIDFGDIYDFAGSAPFTIAAIVRPLSYNGGYLVSKNDTSQWALDINARDPSFNLAHQGYRTNESSTFGGTAYSENAGNSFVGQDIILHMVYSGSVGTGVGTVFRGPNFYTSQTPWGGSIVDTAASMLVGQAISGSADQFLLDSLVIWNRNLNLEEIKTSLFTFSHGAWRINARWATPISPTFDTGTLSEPQASENIALSSTDSATLTEAPTSITVTNFVSATDTATLTDRNGGLAVANNNEPLTATDTNSGIALVGPTDSGTESEPQPSENIALSSTDSATLSETSSVDQGAINNPVSSSDSFTLTDTNGGIGVANNNDPATASDTNSGVILTGTTDSAIETDINSGITLTGTADSALGLDSNAGITLTGVFDTGTETDRTILIDAPTATTDAATETDVNSGIILTGLSDSALEADLNLGVILTGLFDSGAEADDGLDIALARVDSGTGTDQNAGVGPFSTDTFTESEGSPDAIQLSSTDSATLSEATNITQDFGGSTTPTASDTFTFSESVFIDVVVTGTNDTASLVENKTIALANNVDPITLSEGVSIAANANTVDSGTFVENRSIALTGTTDSGALTENKTISLANNVDPITMADVVSNIILTTPNDSGLLTENKTINLANSPDTGTFSENNKNIILTSPFDNSSLSENTSAAASISTTDPHVLDEIVGSIALSGPSDTSTFLDLFVSIDVFDASIIQIGAFDIFHLFEFGNRHTRPIIIIDIDPNPPVHGTANSGGTVAVGSATYTHGTPFGGTMAVNIPSGTEPILL